MLGLVDYQSDEDSSDVADSKPAQEHQTTTRASVATTEPAELASGTAAAPSVVLPASAAMLPDAASLFATTVDSRLLYCFPHMHDICQQSVWELVPRYPFCLQCTLYPVC